MVDVGGKPTNSATYNSLLTPYPALANPLPNNDTIHYLID